MQKKFFLVALSGLLVGARVCGKPGVWKDFADAASRLADALEGRDVTQSSRPSALASAPKAEPITSENVLVEVSGYLHCLSPEDRAGVCRYVEKMIAESSEYSIPTSRDELYEFCARVSKSAIPEYHRYVVGVEVSRACPNMSTVRRDAIKSSSQNSLADNLMVSLKKMNGIECGPLVSHFDRSKIRRGIEANKKTITEEVAQFNAVKRNKEQANQGHNPPGGPAFK